MIETKSEYRRDIESLSARGISNQTKTLTEAGAGAGAGAGVAASLDPQIPMVGFNGTKAVGSPNDKS